MIDGKDLLDLFGAHPQINALKSLIKKEKSVSVSGLKGSSKSCLVSVLSHDYPILCIMDDEDEAGYLYADVENLVTDRPVLFFPSAYKRSIKYGHTDAPNIILRADVLTHLADHSGKKKHPPIIISYPAAIAESVVSGDSLSQDIMVITQGQIIEPDFIRDQLLEWGFERTDYVYEPGQFAIRGSIMDIFSFAKEQPFRLDFFDNEVESIRLFEVESQLSIETLHEITLIPNVVEVQQSTSSLLDLLAPHTLVATHHRGFWLDKIREIYDDAPSQNDGEGFDSLEEMRVHLASPHGMVQSYASFKHLILSEKSDSSNVIFNISPQPIFHKDYDRLTEQLILWKEAGQRTYLTTSSERQYQRITDIIAERGEESLVPERINTTLHEGFVDESIGLVLLTDHQIFDRYHKYNLKSDKARSGKVTLSLKELNTFSPGDYVVHSDHGIGQFGGLITADIGGKKQEVVKIIYRNNDVIFVNLHSLHKLSRYRAQEDGAEVKLSQVGSGAWQRLKDRTKKKVKDIARDLIKLYARRREEQGFAFSADSYMQNELEASFMYEDTPDQAQATADIKADMESPRPMDRLICGDVGFGKTEVAVRAAFKAAADSKQVAVLVPTTVLAYQHYQTFTKRLKDFPVRVDYISRARTAAEVKRILHDLKEGVIDIIIGTHRLTSRDVVFKDLGLLVIDEEQKFGVAVKERLRKMQVNVDTLTMSATPIPRTLQFSLMGARDLSNINTPPPNRYPVETILSRFGSDVIREAINFEMSRNGQVYLVHNRIQNIREVAELVKREVPDARVVIGHGQMSPTELEKIILDFSNQEYDVLIATTIIENGIDVPNANTIIIDDAHRYGLSELHQLRGRVGRSSRKAFCYLLTPPLSSLPDEARRRVQAIESFSDLGSGIRIALQDLDIRGAGNILGAEQSGFIADMGYETYQKVFEEAVSELKAEEFSELYKKEDDDTADRFVVETLVESDLDLSFPEDYVPQDAERILLYRELDNLKTDNELEAFRQRMTDRFGRLPVSALELILVPKLRRLGRNLGIEKIVLRGGQMSFHLIGDDKSLYYRSNMFTKLLTFIGYHSRECEIKQLKNRRIIRVKDIHSVQQAVDKCLEIISQPLI
ncbi:transcription-repair coupling factor [Porphyromonas pogonae]|uniref:transcription-repair coupling factor n=1 Tax=Porphyromonas pogonae TaxID=867595 RepID=UPI002E76FD39|nr:transcription-repair coupling factor [Porphyromonas pogonae]